MKPLTPYLSFNGNCREAMNFYKDVFGGKLEVMTWGDGPPEACGGPENRERLKDKVMHGCLTSGSLTIMASDTPQGELNVGDNIQLCVNCESDSEIDKLFKELGDGGKTIMPLDNTFWGARFGVVVDKFGISWMLNFQLEGKE